MSVSVGWEIYDITRDPLYLGYVGLAQFLPALLFTLPAGFRPAHQMIFPVQWAWGQTRMDINTVGQAFLQGQALALNDWVSFNGITFTAER